MDTVVESKSVDEVSLDDLPRTHIVARQTLSVVYAMKIGGQLWALKGIAASDLSPRSTSQLQREEEALSAMQHPAIPRLRRTFDDGERRWLLMELCQGCTLEKLFYAAPHLPAPLVTHIAAQLVDALAHVHEVGWVYRDLKANNVLLSKRGAASLVDFGLAAPAADCGAAAAGVRHARAPEMVRGVRHTAAVDWWALGVLIWELLSGKPPFGLRDDADDDGGIERRILQGIEGLPLPPAATGPLSDLLRRLLCPDPAARLGAGGAGDVRRHAAFAGVDWAALRAADTSPWRPGAEPPACMEDFEEEIEMQTIGLDIESPPPQTWQ